MKKKAFSIIELLVVIVIIGILSGLGIAQFNSYKQKAEIAKDISELRQSITETQARRIELTNNEEGDIESLMFEEMETIKQAIQIGRKSVDKTLREINNNTNSSDVICRGATFGTVADDDPNTPQGRCISAWQEVYQVISDAANIDISFLQTDPWGSPYLIDENEGEWSSNPCRMDDIFSAGPDKTHGVNTSVNPQEATGDGFEVHVPNLRSYIGTGSCT